MTMGVLTSDQVRSAYEEIDRLNAESREAYRHKEHGMIVMKNGHRVAELQLAIARSQVIAIHALHEAIVARDLPAGTSPP